ncbi:MAG TPA: hypothetical protein ENN35_01880 [Deltaproteobacteria bacterium]|nr:hypothetical protein [Deltaproteobacteria bacterium]
MHERVTGLDIGRDGIKAVSMSAGLRGCRVIDTVLVRPAEAGGLEQALEQVFGRETFRDSRCVTALPMEHCSFRTIRLPFRDRKRLLRTLPYELEPTLPFSADDAVVDYLVLDRGEGTELLAAAARRDHMAERLALLAPFCSSVSVVDVEAASLAGWIAAEECDEVSPSILLDVGAVRTSLAVVAGGRIVQLRSLPAGETHMAEDGVDNVCRTLHREVSATMTMLSLRGVTDEKPGSLYLAGGGSRSEGFRDELGRLFDLAPREPTVPREQAIQFTEEALSAWDPALMNQALSLALRDAGGGPGFNFVRDRNGAAGLVEWFRDELPWLAPLSAAVLLFLGANIYLDYRTDSRYLTALRAETRTLFTQTLPETTRIVNPVQQVKTALDDLRRQAAGGDHAGRPLPVLAVLREVSALVPQSIDLLVTSFTYDEKTVRVQGETDTFNTVDAVRAALENSELFSSVTITSANMMRSGGRVGFDMRIEPRRRT